MEPGLVSAAATCTDVARSSTGLPHRYGVLNVQTGTGMPAGVVGAHPLGHTAGAARLGLSASPKASLSVASYKSQACTACRRYGLPNIFCSIIIV